MTSVGNRLGRTVRRLAMGAVASAAVAALVVPSALATPESDAVDAIDQAWQAAGGADSPVGGRDGEVFGVGDGFGQQFSGGKIYFTPATGAHLIYGAILDKYESLGGPADSDLGFPNIDVVTGLVSPDSRVSTFSATDRPAVFWTPDTGAWSVRGALNAAWDKLGGSAGVLGVPVEDERYNGDVVSQRFTGGELSWNLATNTFTSDPPGLADSLAGLEVPLDPTTMINLAWRSGGGLGGPLGARQGQQATIGDNAAAQGYAGGKIFYSPQTGAHAVTGAILSKYESLGGPTGDLGFPVGGEADGGVPNSRVNSFSAPDKPVIFWTPDTGAIVVRGPINAAWAKLGGATGTLGVPTGEQTAKGDTVSQDFTGGEITWNKATKEFSTDPAELKSQLSGLEMPDAVAQAPATPATGTGSESGGWRWWWLAIILPVLALLGLLARRVQRQGATDARETVPVRRDYFSTDSEDDFWPGTRSADTDRDMWSPPPVAEEIESGLDSDEDAIDTAPTRIPTEAELEESSTPEFDALLADSGLGRHAAGSLGTSSSAWRLELDELAAAPRRRHAVEDYWTEEIDVVVDDVVVEEAPGQVPFEFEAEPVAETEYAAELSDEDPWRPAIHLPLADPFQAPEGYSIKGNTHSGLYYTPDSVLYDNTIPEVWFASEELAQANGFVKAPE
ncbi:MAG: LGFP repeat-containing protein [Mycobacterium sp.]